MADVFISYSREDRPRAEQVAQALQSAGLDVFWDNEIPPGTTWADYIESKLTQCKALIVLWSAHSTKSQWVREEARMGRDKGVLIPAMIDASQAPFGFGEVQAANLASWNGEPDHPEWRRFLTAVRNASGAPARAATVPPPRTPLPTPPPPTFLTEGAKKPGARWPWIVGAIVGTIVVLGIIGNMMPDHSNAPVQQAAVPAAAPEQQQQQEPQQQATGDQNAQQIILAQLQQAQSALAQQGFTALGQPYSGGLQQGQNWDVPLDLYAGYDYRVIGVCDRDCNDLDLVLFDPGGVLATQDTSTDDHPLVSIQPTVTGRFNLRVQMYNCSVAPCYYAVALYGRRPG